MSNSILASLRESFPESDFTLAATSGGSTTIATNYYYWVNGYSRGGMNLLTPLGQVSVSIGQKLVWTVTNIAPGDDVFGFILSASTTNDTTTAKILAIAPAKASNQETLIPAPLAIELTHDSHFGLGITSALPTSNLLNGMIRYADGQYQQYSSQLNDWEIVNGWNSYLASTTSPLVTGVYKNGCDVPILSNESIIPLADYTGGTSTRFRLALQNGLTEGSGSILPTGSKIALNILLENNEAFAAQYLNEGQVQINPVHTIRRSDGTVTALDDSTLVWEWGKPFYTLTADLLRGYAIAFDITVVNATLPKGANLTFYLSEYGRISERVQSTGAGSLIYNGGDRLRIYPAQIGVLRGTGNGLLEVTGETYSYPVNASSRDFFASGLQPNTAAQIVALSGLTNGEITFRSNVNQLLATEKIRAIASTQSVTVTPSAWVSIGSVSANQVINVTITYPCDADGIGTIRSDYPDVIAGSEIGEFNPDKLRVFLRKNGTTITETTAIAVTPGPSQGFIITDVGTTSTLPPNTANNLGFWDYGTITTTPSGSSSNLTAGTYEICVAYQYEGNTVVSLSHATIDGCLPELEYDLATAIAKAGYFSKVYESETLKPQLEGLNFANNWFTVTQNGTKLDIELTGVARMWAVASPPGVTFDETDGVQKGDSARLTVPPYDIYDCLDPTEGSAVWKKRSFFGGSYNDLSDKPNNTIVVTVTGGEFRFNGQELSTGLLLLPNSIYQFDLSDPSNATYTLSFSTTIDGTNNGGTAYTTGVTTTGTPGTDGILTFNVPLNAPETLYPYCPTHALMGGSTVFNTKGGGASDASEITVDASGFSGNLSTTDTDVQTALETIDSLVISPSITSRGTWDSGTSYIANDIVHYAVNGNTYIANTNNTNKIPGTDPEWHLFAQKGDTGSQGVQGEQGIQGEQGTAGLKADVTRTSSTSNTIGTGSKSFTFDTASNNLGWLVGTRLRATATAGNFMSGVVTSVSTTDVTINIDYISGSGTYTTWNISIAGEIGTPGSVSSASSLNLAHIATPSAPSAGNTLLYAKDDGKVYRRAAGENEVEIGSFNNTFPDNVFRIQDNLDNTKQLAFETSGITTGTTRTLTVPDSNGTVLSTDTLTDKALYYYDASSKLFKPVGIGTAGQALIAQPSSNPPYQWATPTGGGREVLTADRTYYVRTDGNDSNNGLTDTAGGAFLTWNKAHSVISAIDGNGYKVTVKFNDGTRTTPIEISRNLVGISELIIEGNTATPSNCVINVTGNAFNFRSVPITCTLKGFQIVASVIGISMSSCSFIIMESCVFGNCAFHVVNKRSGAEFYAYTISGNAGYHFIVDQGTIGLGGVITLTGTRAFTTFAWARYQGIIENWGGSFSGSATGKRYDSTYGSVIMSSGQTFPGNSSGTSTTGYYI